MTDSLLNARQLVEQLTCFGITNVTPAAVRKWIHEEPACPIAQHSAGKGQPHRYNLLDVLDWLRARHRQEKAKGFTRGDGLDLDGLIGVAMAHLKDPESIPAPQPRAKPAEPLPTTAAKNTDWINLHEVDALLEVLQGRDPRNWKAAEEALTHRRNRLIAEGRLIPVDEFQAALDAHVADTAALIAMAESRIKQALRACVPIDQRPAVDAAVASEFNSLRKRLAEPVDAGSAKVA